MEGKYKKCYNCTGTHMNYTCGFPTMGCPLCKKYGDGEGNLLEEYYNKEVKIMVGDTERIFTPPSYKCIYCKDSFVTNIQIYDEDCVDNICTNPLAFMPRVNARCDKCNPECDIPTKKEQEEKYFECKEKFLQMGEIIC